MIWSSVIFLELACISVHSLASTIPPVKAASNVDSSYHYQRLGSNKSPSQQLEVNPYPFTVQLQPRPCDDEIIVVMVHSAVSVSSYFAIIMISETTILLKVYSL